MSDKKYCEDCKYFKIGSYRCNVMQQTLVLRNKAMLLDCFIARLDPDACGPGARYWMAKDD